MFTTGVLNKYKIINQWENFKLNYYLLTKHKFYCDNLKSLIVLYGR